MLKFFYSTQTCSTAVHLALAELEIPFEGIEVSWKRKVNLAELEAVNPLGQVPAIVDGNKTLIQTITILEYLADKAPLKKMLPAAGTWERTQAQSWLTFIGADFQKGFLPFALASRWTSSTEAQTDIRNFNFLVVDKHLAYLDKALAGKDYLLGSQISVVDLYAFTITGWCKWSEVKVGKYTNLTKFLKRIYDRPAVQKVLAKEEMLDFLPS